MFSYSIPTSSLRQVLLETVDLEHEHYEQARFVSPQLHNELHQWQIYLNTLAVLGLTKWCKAKMPNRPVKIDWHEPLAPNSNNCCFEVDGFKLCALAVEHIWNESIEIPVSCINNPEWAAHFYVVAEIMEEQEQLVIRGYLRFDQLTSYIQQSDLQPLANGCYRLPLDIFEPEPNHLLYYLQYLQPQSIALPASSPTISPIAKLVNPPAEIINLQQWLEGIISDTWVTLESLLNPDSVLAFNTRTVELSKYCGKLIDLGMKLGQNQVALIVGVSKEQDEKLTVSVQLHPTNRGIYLPSDIQISLISRAGKNLQTVQARAQDNYIQLKPFRGSLGQQFRIEVRLGDTVIEESFDF
jgi:hypothetical protein